MASKNVTQALKEAAQSILRPLVRVLLRNGIPYGAFAEMARRAYVEMAEKDFALPGKKQTVSRISTLTGLTRKEVARIQATEVPSSAEDQDLYPGRASVIAGGDPTRAYHARRGNPADLPMDGETK